MNLFAGVTPALNAVSKVLYTLPGMRQVISGQVRGTFTATLTPQLRKSGSTEWRNVPVEDAESATDAEVSSFTGPGSFSTGDLAGEWEFRFQITAYTSGTPEVWADAEV